VRTVELGRAPQAGAAAKRTARPVRVAVISDLHMDADREPFTSLADHVNGADPDLILLLGDTLNSPRGLKTLRRSLRRMRARHGKFAVRGNWEVWYWSRLSVLKGTGFSWLRGRQVTRTIRGTTVHLTGLDYSDNLSPQTLARTMRRLGAARPAGWRLFLYHTPDLAEQVPAAQLYLAGHTHGGQISVPLFGALVTLSRHGKRYERGLTALGWRRWIYVNPGVGVEPMVPLRLGVRPEVTLFELGQPPVQPVEGAAAR
jgi:predicted MPP superfamily phosphohydrolase